MKKSYALFALLMLVFGGCQVASNSQMPELPFHVELGKNWHLAEDEVLYSWTYGIAQEGGVLFIKEPVQGALSALRDEDAEVFSNADGSIVSFCDSGRCLITIDGNENRYWATMKDDGLPVIRGEKAIEHIFDNLELD